MHDAGQKRVVIDYVGPQVDCGRFPVKRAVGETVTVVACEYRACRLSSLLWFMRQLTAQRKSFRAFGRGTMQFLASDNSKVLTYLRTDDQECILAVANLSRQSQAVHIQVPGSGAYHVRDIFSSNEFPRIVYQDTFFLKLYRRLEEGINPDVELSRALTEETTFVHLPAYAGAVGWQRESAPPLTLALLLQFVPSQGDAWSLALDNNRQFAPSRPDA